MTKPEKLNLVEMDERYAELIAAGVPEAMLGGRLSRHLADGDYRLSRLRFDNSVASFRLWNFLLTEEERLYQARAAGKYIVATMKDLGTVPVMAYSMPDTVAFYPDGAWWIPCVMELSAGLLQAADSLGLDESFCPVRAMLPAFLAEGHFPQPDQVICSSGAVCDDFSAIAQRLNGLGTPMDWWEVPYRRMPEDGEEAVQLPDGTVVPKSLVTFTCNELARVKKSLETRSGHQLSEDDLWAGIRYANSVRDILGRLRYLVFTAPVAPLPSLELLIAEMTIIHYCSDKDLVKEVLQGLLDEASKRVDEGVGILPEKSARVYWVNPVADILVMNIFEDCGCRLCGTDFMFCHSLQQIPGNGNPLEALAKTVLQDPMIGSAHQRAARICRELEEYGAEGVVISRIPGASHCAYEGRVIHDHIVSQLDIPVVEIEVPCLVDTNLPVLQTRLQALVETIVSRR